MRDRKTLAAGAAVLVAVIAFVLAITSGDDEDPGKNGSVAATSAEPGETTAPASSGGQPGDAPGGDRGEEGASPADDPPGGGTDGPGGGPDTSPPDSGSEGDGGGGPDSGGSVGEQLGATGGEPVGEVPDGAGAGADRRAVRRVIRAYLLAIASGDGSQACAQLTAAGRRRKLREITRIAIGTEGTPCSSAILLYQGAYGDAINNPRIKNLRVGGSRARAVGPASEVATLVKLDGVWLLSRYGH